MITEEMLTNQEELKALTPEQRAAIITLSKNDENTVISQRTGDIYRQMDETIKAAMGIDRNGAEKTYDYLKRAATEYAGKYTDYETLKTKVTALEKDKKDLQDKIDKGITDDEARRQLTSVKEELRVTKEQYATLKDEKDKAEARFNQNVLGMRIASEIAAARTGLKFKQGLSEQAIENLLSIVEADIKTKNPRYEGEAGKETVRYYDANGVIMNNPNNKLNPYTTKELFLQGIEKLDILDKESVGGAGGGSNKPSGGRTIVASTQVEAMSVIEKELLEKGFVRGTSEYQAEVKKVWDENKCDELPEGY